MLATRTMVGLLILTSIMGLTGCAATSHLISPVQGVTRFADCPTAPRCAISQADAGGDQVLPLRAGGDAASAHAHLIAVLRADPAYRILSDDGRYLHAEFTTALMRYRDDVEFLVRDDGSIDVRSSGRIGWYDGGANRKRIEALRSALDARAR